MKEKYHKIWADARWTKQARNLIAGLNGFPEDSKLIMVLRHSHRNSSTDAEKLSRLKLTKQGHEIARIFGTKLPTNRPIRLFHSLVERCKETAEGVLEGFRSIGGKGEIHGVLESLYNIGPDGHYIINQAIKLAGQRFLNNWSNGEFPSDKITLLSEYSISSAKEIWSLVEQCPRNCIDIHVSHDLSIMGFRKGWFGLNGEDWWVSFMGGFAMMFNEGDILLLDRGKVGKKAIPNWWN